MELRAELTGRDGQKRPLRVRCEPDGELRGLLSGLAQLREQVAALLGPLVQQETGGGDSAGSGGESEFLPPLRAEGELRCVRPAKSPVPSSGQSDGLQTTHAGRMPFGTTAWYSEVDCLCPWRFHVPVMTDLQPHRRNIPPSPII